MKIDRQLGILSILLQKESVTAPYLSENVFSGREAVLPDLRDERVFPGGIKVKALFEADCKWRLVEEFGANCFEEQEEGSFLRGQYDDIIPGYYMNKQHWNSVNPNGEIEDELLKDLLDKSYNLVLGGFSRKKQSEILKTRPLRNED